MTDFPEKLKDMLFAAYGDSACGIMKGCVHKRPTTFRINTLKATAEEVENELASVVKIRKSLLRGAYIVTDGQEKLRETEAYKSGKIYVQSLSSMLPPLAVDPKAGESILDMCAAPGGKTTQMAAMSGGKAAITACEKSPVRAERLKYNLAKQGSGRVFVMNRDAATLDGGFSFDKILLDAPCSGSGTSDAVKFSEQLLAGCMRTQKRLIAKAWELLKKGGTLVYSTCSVLPCENGDMLKSVLGGSAEYLDISHIVPADVGMLPCAPMTVTVCPNELYEGFFVAALRKPL